MEKSAPPPAPLPEQPTWTCTRCQCPRCERLDSKLETLLLQSPPRRNIPLKESCAPFAAFTTRTAKVLCWYNPAFSLIHATTAGLINIVFGPRSIFGIIPGVYVGAAFFWLFVSLLLGCLIGLFWELWYNPTWAEDAQAEYRTREEARMKAMRIE